MIEPHARIDYPDDDAVTTLRRVPGADRVDGRRLHRLQEPLARCERIIRRSGVGIHAPISDGVLHIGIGAQFFERLLLGFIGWRHHLHDVQIRRKRPGRVHRNVDAPRKRRHAFRCRSRGDRFTTVGRLRLQTRGVRRAHLDDEAMRDGSRRGSRSPQHRVVLGCRRRDRGHCGEEPGDEPPTQ